MYFEVIIIIFFESLYSSGSLCYSGCDTDNVANCLGDNDHICYLTKNFSGSPGDISLNANDAAYTLKSEDGTSFLMEMQGTFTITVDSNRQFKIENLTVYI
jgi:hypothetical protein